MGNEVGLTSSPHKRPNGPPFVPTSADNGLSVDTVSGKIVLGNDIGDPGKPAQLLNPREIPMPPGTVILFNDGNGNQTALAPAAVDVVGATAMVVQLRPGLVRTISDVTSPGNPAVLWLFTGIANKSAQVDLDISNGFSALRFFRINPTQGITFDIDDVRIGVGVPVPTAGLHLQAGVAGVSGSPFKYTPGVPAQAIVENGAKNFDGSNETLAAGGVTYTLAKTLTATGVLDFPNTAAQNSSDLTIAVPGAVLGDVVSVGVPNGSVLPNSCFTGWVSAPGTVTIRFNNYSAGAQDPASGTFRASVTRY
jgi:hypothetical protein